MSQLEQRVEELEKQVRELHQYTGLLHSKIRDLISSEQEGRVIHVEPKQYITVDEDYYYCKKCGVDKNKAEICSDPTQQHCQVGLLTQAGEQLFNIIKEEK